MCHASVSEIRISAIQYMYVLNCGIGQSVNVGQAQAVGQSFSQSVSRSVCQSISMSVDRSDPLCEPVIYYKHRQANHNKTEKLLCVREITENGNRLRKNKQLKFKAQSVSQSEFPPKLCSSILASWARIGYQFLLWSVVKTDTDRHDWHWLIIKLRNKAIAHTQSVSLERQPQCGRNINHTASLTFHGR